MLYRSFLCVPSLCAALVMFFLPVASHVLYSGAHLIPHYRASTPLNWLIIKSRGNVVSTFFSNEGAARYGFTPIWFNHSMPSSGAFIISDPGHAYGWVRTEDELATGRTTHLAIRKFQLGMITATCYEYRDTYTNTAGASSSIYTPLILWESLCSTQSNGADYNLRAAFLGHREDLPAFYVLLNSATPVN